MCIRDRPDPISKQVLAFLSIISIICAESIICLFIESFSVDLLIKFIFLFSLNNNDLNSSKAGNVSRETFNVSN